MNFLKKFGRKILVGVVLAGMVVALEAGPTVIRDNRIKDTALTPVLGRGYSLSTNTFQSTCMREVRITEPSYDFKYTFREIESSSSSKSAKATSLSVDASYWFVKTQLDVQKKENAESKKTSHNILVTLDMDTYYASVDESLTRLSDTASELLKKNDIPGFFNSCGSYYVRSLGRNARFLALFTYKSESSKRDRSFEADLKVQLKGIAGRGSVAAGRKESSSNEASSRELTITVRGYGLGKNESASLISYDLETFKAAIKEAFISMQNPLTGKVETMEIVPWVENTEFQNMIELEKKTTGTVDASGKEVKETELMFEKKQILNLNGEFLAEINRASRNYLNIYYKAKICRVTVDANWAQKNALLDRYKSAVVRNNRTGETNVTLEALYAKLSDAELQALLDGHKEFMYGSKDFDYSTPPTKGAAGCMTKIMEKNNIYKLPYFRHAECNEIIPKFAAVQGDMVSDHCMPGLAY